MARLRCKKKDVLALGFEDYKTNLAALVDGFQMARDFLIGERIFRMRDLPYTTQIIPLAATCAYVGKKKFSSVATKNVLRRWLRCGTFGQMYGGANETRYANHIEDLVDQIEGRPSQMRTVNSAHFQATRLLGLQTRNSAAYKGVMALVFRENALDFIDGEQMTNAKACSTPPDIHHIFPQDRRIRPSASACRWGFRPNFYCQDDPNAGNWGESHLTARVGTRLTPTVGAILDQQCVLGRSERGELGRREEPKRPGISLSHEESWVWSSEMRGIRVVAIPDGMVSKCRGRFPRLFSYGGVWESRASS